MPISTRTGYSSINLKGARLDEGRQTLSLSVVSRNGAHIEAWFYDAPSGVDEFLRLPLSPDGNGLWSVTVPLAHFDGHDTSEAIYFGYRAWGPNWPFDQGWTKGSEIGFRADVDDGGHRFNPNKLLLDPYAFEISHDPGPHLSAIDPNESADLYYSGPDSRCIDTGAHAPKSVCITRSVDVPIGTKPQRPLKDDVIYEVHVRSFTKRDASVPAHLQGTYQGAALKASYLKQLGVTAVEFLPVFHFASEQNDDGNPLGDNHWGYMTLGFMAPNRRYSSDKSPGGPTREFKTMVRAFHDAGIKVFLDVVFNHTGEGMLKRHAGTDAQQGRWREDDTHQHADRAAILSFRGLDNALYYTLRSRKDLDEGHGNFRYQDNSACGPSLNVADDAVREFVLDSLGYWAHEMGVDGFRFDLAPVLGNSQSSERFVFDWNEPQCLLRQIGAELPLRSEETPHGVDLIAEPWATGTGDTYQLGHFPDGWGQWNDVYRQTLRNAENKLHVVPVGPDRVADAVSGSAKHFGSGPGSRPASSVNYIASHDGFCLRDLVSNTDGDGWDHSGMRAEQRKAIRNAFALLLSSAGVPMLLGGDELFSTLGGRTNTVAIDDPSVYLDWTSINAYLEAAASGDGPDTAKLRTRDEVRTFCFARAMLQFRQRYGCLRPASYFTGNVGASGLRDIAWYGADGNELTQGWSDPTITFLGYRFDGSLPQPSDATSLYVAYNWGDQFTAVTLPRCLFARRWHRFADTAEWAEVLDPAGNIDSQSTVVDQNYGLHPRSVAIFIER